MKILLLPQAQEGLDAIAEPMLSRVIHRIEVLKEYPELGVPMAGPFSGYRSTVVELFRIVYRLKTKDLIEVAYLRDCCRRPL